MNSTLSSSYTQAEPPVSELDSLKQVNASLTSTVEQLHTKMDQMQQQLDWFKRQLFGQKSEKRLLVDSTIQQSLFDGMLPKEAPSQPMTKTVAAHERKLKQRDGCTTDSGLRFDDSVPVQVVEILPDELKGDDADRYEVISQKVTFRLAQQRASFVVIEERRPVIKEKDTQKLITTPAPARVLDNSFADVSFLVGMLIDKFLYHLPLYRQHQRLSAGGITLSRGVLTQLTGKTISLLKPIADAQARSVLMSQVLAIDETPIKAGRKGPGKMRQGYFWPMYGDQGEILFRYCSSRSGSHLESLLSGFNGTLLTDGYAAYERYAKKYALRHAQCWAHNRRGFEKALAMEPEAATEALALIGMLYEHETQIREQALTDQTKRDYRQAHSAPVAVLFWQWCDQQCTRLDLTPSNPLSKALNYARERKTALEVFLDDPAVAIDTNHLERGLRPIPMGKKCWLFCWTEAGAEDVAAIQSLLATCRLHGVDCYDYLVDVLQRVAIHPASEVHLLTPRLWKEQFAMNPMRSVVDQRKTACE